MNLLPEFESRQVLTSDELNWLTCFLDSQNRQSRKLLIGCGVVGGLQLILNKTNNSIQITNGCALTSAGHIVTLDKNENSQTTTFKKIKKYAQKDKELLSFPYLSDGIEEEKDYSKSVTNPSIYFSEFKDEVFELFEETYNDANFLQSNQVEGKVALAFAEIIQTELKDCEEDNCQDKGKKYTFNTKILLISEADALNLLNLQFQLASSSAAEISKKAFPWLYIPNINILKPVFSNLTTTKLDEAQIIKEYRRCIDSLKSVLTTNSAAIDIGLNNLNKFISIRESNLTFAQRLIQTIDQLNNSSTNKNIYQTQVQYDYFWTVIKAYQEIQQTAQALRAKCLIAQSAFPNHVLLGKVVPSNQDWEATISHTEEVFRHPFYSQYAQTEQALLSRKLRFLFNRLSALLDNFDSDIFKALKPIRLSPGASLFDQLSQQAIPYYLKSEVANNWNLKAAHPYLKQNNTTYSNQSNQNAENIYNKQPLAYQGDHSFFRVEGVHGQLALNALNSVFQIRKTYGLSYEVIMLRLNEDAPENYSFNFSVNEDIESIYQIIRAELLKQISLNTTYLGNLRFKEGKYEEMKRVLVATLAKYYESNIRGLSAGRTVRQRKNTKTGYADIKQNEESSVNLQLVSKMQNSKRKGDLVNQFAQYIPLYPIIIFHINSLSSLVDEIKSQDAFKNKNSVGFYTNLLDISKITSTKNAVLFYKTLRLYCALRLQELTLTENFLEFDIEDYLENLEDELLKACDDIIPFLKNASSDFIKSDAVLTEVVKGEMLDYADRIKFDDDWIKMAQIDAENKKRNVGLEVDNLLQRFLQFHPGIAHGCGVPKGGTYIMVYDKNNIVTADFYLPYILSSQLRPIQYTLLENKTITLSGTVADEEKSPIVGATVRINDNSVLTNAKGEYISLVEKNTTLSLTISADGYEDKTEGVTIGDASKSQDFTLKAKVVVKKFTTIVQFLNADGGIINLNIKLRNKEEEAFEAIAGKLAVNGESGESFGFILNDERFKLVSFVVIIQGKNDTKDVELTPNVVNNDFMKTTLLITDLLMENKLAKVNSVKLNGTPIVLVNGIKTQSLDINYNSKTLTIEIGSLKAPKYVTGIIPFLGIDSVIVLIKNGRETSPGKRMTAEEKKLAEKRGELPRVITDAAESVQLFTFSKAFPSVADVDKLVEFNAGFLQIPKAILAKTNFYCFLISPSDLQMFKRLF